MNFKFVNETTDRKVKGRAYRAAKDKSGIIWFATSKGVLRYDGVSQVYQEHISRTLSNLAYGDIEFDNKNNLWLGVSRGVAKYDLESNQITPITQKGKMLGVKERGAGLLLDGDSMLVGLFSKLGVVDTVTNKVTEIEIQNAGENLLHARSVLRTFYKDSNGILWIGTDSSGLIRYDPSSQSAESFNLTNALGGEKNLLKIRNIIPNPRNNKELLISSLSGLLVFNKDDGSFKLHPLIPTKEKTIYSLATASNGDVWVGGINIHQIKNNGELVKYSKERDFRITKPSEVNLIYIDDQDTVFVFYEDVGMFKASIPSSKVKVMSDFNLGTTRVKSLMKTTSAEVWVGFDSGLIRGVFENGAFSFEEVRKDNESFANINDLYEGPTNSVWVAETTRISRIDGDISKVYLDLRGFANEENYLEHVVEDRSGTLWFTLYRKGLFKVDSKTKEILFVTDTGKYHTYLAMNPTNDILLLSYRDNLKFYNVDDTSEIDSFAQPIKEFRSQHPKKHFSTWGVKSASKDEVIFTFATNYIASFRWSCSCFSLKETRHYVWTIDYASLGSLEDFFWASNVDGYIHYMEPGSELKNLMYVDGVPEDGVNHAICCCDCN